MSECVSKKIDNKYEIILLNVEALQKTTVTVAMYMLLLAILLWVLQAAFHSLDLLSSNP